MHWVAGCGMRTVNETIGQLQHYREPDIPETLENPVIDDVIWRYKQPLVEKTQAVLRQLGLLRWVQVPDTPEAVLEDKPVETTNSRKKDEGVSKVNAAAAEHIEL